MTDVALHKLGNLLAKDNGDGTFGLYALPSPDQDPIFDHANGTKTSVTASATVLTPPADCKFARIESDGDCFVRTDGEDAADAAGSIKVYANMPEIIPVVEAVDVKAYAASAATVRCTPMKTRA